MAYSIHLTREPNNGLGPIELDQWQAIADGRSDIRTVESMSVQTPQPGTSISVPGPFWLWSGHTNESDLVLRFSNGSLSGDNPDTELLALFLSLAVELDAVVQGDEGEQYRSTSDLGLAEDGGPSHSDTQRTSNDKPWWKFWQ